MKIVYIYRQPGAGRYSIETIFHAVAAELDARGEQVIEYQLGSQKNLFSEIRALRDLDADIYHITGDVNYLAPFLPRLTTVLTLHDIGHYLYTLRGIKRQLYKMIWLQLPINASRLVTAVSQATKEDCVNCLGVEGSRIQVIENCVSPVFQPAPGQFNKSRPRILQVGTKPYKNVPRLVAALRGIPCHLVLVGELDGAIREALRDCGVAYENHIGLSQEALYDQYVKADLVAFVSVGEGFGVPILEAQAVGRPLLTSGKPPLSVAAGGGACLADPLSIESIRQCLLKLIDDDDYRSSLVARGHDNVARYSVQAVAGAYLDSYKMIAAA